MLSCTRTKNLHSTKILRRRNNVHKRIQSFYFFLTLQRVFNKHQFDTYNTYETSIFRPDKPRTKVTVKYFSPSASVSPSDCSYLTADWVYTHATDWVCPASIARPVSPVPGNRPTVPIYCLGPAAGLPESRCWSHGHSPTRSTQARGS